MNKTVEVNVSNAESMDDLVARVAAASYFGTLQAGFTDFHYLRSIWSQTTQKDALIGVSMTGIASGKILKYDLQVLALTAKEVNSVISEQININEAARVTCVKPAGTTSLVLKTSSGIHAWFAPFYDRIMRFGKNEALAIYLMIMHPEICEDDILRPSDTLCVRIPVKAPEGAILRTESALDTLERVKKFSQEWIKFGHNSGDNTHNVSATISIDKNRMYHHINGIPYKTATVSMYQLNEWEEVGQWMWKNKDVYNGLSIIPHDGGNYVQMPFTEISETEYNQNSKLLRNIDLSKVIEMEDHVDFGQAVACAGGSCSIE